MLEMERIIFTGLIIRLAISYLANFNCEENHIIDNNHHKTLFGQKSWPELCSTTTKDYLQHRSNLQSKHFGCNYQNSISILEG